MLLTHFVPGMTQLYWENSIYWTFIHILFHLWSQNLACFPVVLKRPSSLYDSQNMGFILTPCFSEFVGLWVWDALTSCSTYCTKDFEGGGECISSQTSRWHGSHTKGKQTQAVTDIYLLGLLVVVGGHSWLQYNPPLQVSFTPLGLRKSLGILRKVLEASRVDSHLKLKGPQGKHTVKILESASILPAESKLTKNQLNSQWVGPGGTGNGSNNGSSGLDIGEVCLGDRHQRFVDLGPGLFPFVLVLLEER